MILYYAFGGGLGHLTRAAAIMNTLNIIPADFLIITSSGYANLVFNNEKIIKVPEEYYQKPDLLRTKIEKTIIENSITHLFIDSFPAGINGELNHLNLENCKIVYIARMLNFDNYSINLTNHKLNFDTTYIIEKLSSSHLNFIQNNSKSYENLELNYPNAKINNEGLSIISKIQKPVWLIAHSADYNEVNQLLSYAKEIAGAESVNPSFIVITQVKERLEIEHGVQINYFPASHFYPFADKIFTACGFNSMYETAQYANKHHFIPFERKFDNQFERAKNRRNGISMQ